MAALYRERYSIRQLTYHLLERVTCAYFLRPSVDIHLDELFHVFYANLLAEAVQVGPKMNLATIQRMLRSDGL